MKPLCIIENKAVLQFINNRQKENVPSPSLKQEFIQIQVALRKCLWHKRSHKLKFIFQNINIFQNTYKNNP